MLEHDKKSTIYSIIQHFYLLRNRLFSRQFEYKAKILKETEAHIEVSLSTIFGENLDQLWFI